MLDHPGQVQSWLNWEQVIQPPGMMMMMIDLGQERVEVVDEEGKG